MFIFILASEAVPQNEKILEIGEELNYSVYYGFIKLGEVKFKITGKNKEEKSDVFTATASIKSFEAIPLVNINYIFESQMNYSKGEVHSNKFTATEFKEKSITNIYYTFDYDDKKIRTLKEVDGYESVKQDFNMEVEKNFQDGLSLLYNARLQSLQDKTKNSNNRFNVPVYINEKESSVRYSYNFKPEEVEIDMLNYDARCIRVAGVADFVGVFGLTGEFAGWFSDDEYRVPLKAKFNVTIGSITLELESFKKRGWKAPGFVKQ